MNLKLLNNILKYLYQSCCWVNFPEIPLFVTLLLINFTMIPANGLNMENIYVIKLQ